MKFLKTGHEKKQGKQYGGLTSNEIYRTGKTFCKKELKADL